MDKSIIYMADNVTVEVERIFAGEKTIKELIFELLQKRYESDSLSLQQDSVGDHVGKKAGFQAGRGRCI